MKLFLTTLSPTLPFSGINGIVEDLSYAKDSVGFPFIPGKTVKGLISDGVDDMLEMLSHIGVNTRELVDLTSFLFGRRGEDEGALHLPNFYLISEISEKPVYYKQAMLRTKEGIEHGGLKIRQKHIDSFVSVIRNQTSINTVSDAEQNSRAGVAKKGTLRKARLLKPGLHFCGELTGLAEDHDELLKAYLSLACLFVERMGVRRTRGWGSVILKTIESVDVDRAIETLTAYVYKDLQRLQVSKQDQIPGQHTGKRTLRISLQAPIILGDRTKSTFNEESKHYIPGKSIRGMLAANFLKANSMRHGEGKSDTTFRDLFMDHHVTFGNAYITSNGKVMSPVPVHTVTDKYNPESNKAYTLALDGSPMEGGPAKQGDLNQYCTQNNNSLELTTVIRDHHFHQDRDSEYGKNVNGAIYYYESIREGQAFTAEITGNEKYLHKLEPYMHGISRIGKSRSSQYGLVELDTVESTEANRRDEISHRLITIYAISPVIVLNDRGIPDTDAIDNVIWQRFNDSDQPTTNKYPDLCINYRKVKTTVERMYNPMWRGFEDAVPSIAIGSVFEIDMGAGMTTTESEVLRFFEKGIGELTHIGFGRLSLWPTGSRTWDITKLDATPVEVKGTIDKFISHIKFVNEESEAEKERFEYALKFKGRITNALVGRIIYELTELKMNSASTYEDWESKFCEIVQSQRDGCNKFKVREPDKDCLKLGGRNLFEADLYFPLLNLSADAIMYGNINTVIGEWKINSWISMLKILQKLNKAARRS